MEDIRESVNGKGETIVDIKNDCFTKSTKK